MHSLKEFIGSFPDVSKALDYDVYPLSIHQLDDSWIFLVSEGEYDTLIIIGERSNDFSGQIISSNGVQFKKAFLTHENAVVLRRLFPFTAPTTVLQKERSFGVGDRLGIATTGHIQVFKEYDAFPVFAQQSIRELTLTNRRYEDVLDVVTFAVFKEDFQKGFGADGDHLKKEEEIENALSLGYTMITLDCSEHIRNDVLKMTELEVEHCCELPEDLISNYLYKHFDIEGNDLVFDKLELKKCYLIYGKAIEFAAHIYKKYFIERKANANFEISIDETDTPTSPMQHFFVARELISRGVRLDTLAPRFCGEFQKGIDYIGNIADFEKELIIHAGIARHFDYKLSIHSGSDKFSIFEFIGKHTRGRFHVKTAGTNWLEAMKTVAVCDPSLYREIHKFALSMFKEATKYYHVTTNTQNIPSVDNLKDIELKTLFQQNDARQLIHITYGFILSAKNKDGTYQFKTRLYELWRKNATIYQEMLYEHIGNHLKQLYLGFPR